MTLAVNELPSLSCALRGIFRIDCYNYVLLGGTLYRKGFESILCYYVDHHEVNFVL